MKRVLSIVVATKNRAHHLRLCLESIRLCAVPAGWDVEAIVVDNGSEDSTKSLINEYAISDSAVEFRYAYEPHPGKSLAVNLGVAIALGEIVVFTDDDATVAPDWLTEVAHVFQEDPELALLTGKVVLRNSGSVRVAFTRSDSAVELTRLRSLEGLVLGCNLAIRRKAVLKVKGCDTRIGPGTGLGGQDIDLAYRVLRAGYKGRFSPRPLVFHDPASRERSRDYLRGWGAFYMKFLLHGDFYVARKAWWEICRIFRDAARGRRTGTSSPLGEISQMLMGALIMLGRTFVVSATLRPRKASS